MYVDLFRMQSRDDIYSYIGLDFNLLGCFRYNRVFSHWMSLFWGFGTTHFVVTLARLDYIVCYTKYWCNDTIFHNTIHTLIQLSSYNT